MDLNDLKFIEEQLGRKPNDVEIGMFENLWSEHCSYRSTKKLLSMFGKTVKENQNIVVGPGDDAALIKIDDETDLCVAMAMESHNHPSYIDPYNGAATGVGGIVRDIISMNAKPIALLNALRFGDINGEEKDKVRWLVEGVVDGIRDYGNRIGVPNVGGECEFDKSYDYNNLVNVVCIGLVKEGDIVTGKAKETDLTLILVGSTGRDGIGGASFASKDLTSESEGDRPSVQIGDAFTEKCVIDSTLEACATKKVKAIKDLGAAGITSSCSELCYSGGVGAELYLENVILRDEGMTAYEIMVSESQERMLLAVEKGSEEEIIKIFEKYELPVSIIGKTTDTKRFFVKMNDEVVVDLPLDLLCEATLTDSEEKETILETPDNKENIAEPEPAELNNILLKLLKSPNINSKKWIYEQYDHEVQLNTVVRPGKDASVLRLKEAHPKALALVADCNPTYCKLNPYGGSLNLVCESVRNLATVGAKPIGMLDNLNFGNPEKPERFYQIKKCIEGLADGAEIIGVPVVGGNVSLYNETVIDGKDYPINPTPVISIVGTIENINNIPKGAKEGDILIITAPTKDEMGGTEYYKQIHNTEEGIVPKANLEVEKEIYSKVCELVNNGLINEAVDCSKGGLGVAISKLCMTNNIGVELDLGDYNTNGLRNDILLFSESSGRIILSVDKNNADKVVKELNGAIIGTVKGNELKIKLNDNELINLPIEEMKNKYENAFSEMMGENI
ncbi:phosphoribosylformylglycinamidine synthase II [Methanococcus aeolicus Nankai-3]|uniref:Phosphoribosylformylglycinamidine synthase subunit PurL n=1 Tax=Methanococcus aeolicus (strain ATCC BAA-1280 / DSM 17508 / OCM 812 / Nankai-3) TaxID=419665 RepID=PURL_META3|nr:phosphoribosylformylglycinamidine synthase subunit PurL [Methanococcus aeolicus]A6UX13.1 RecName: Full=Phosphoribosylformylglycinamidine synthase subunit PurL; Short=FGAM synthase; AltName: Full=Formylglycinamide ribonucleotide amidotransferase subunit II; Short=FGAR amidotransferase II; Short=FGAR-AT II; AltName: Full=Glutamine amidotransferase PurL; AltName: Full=Phosphoribosylformylglycinamidine synthase subunit II [Methanococcus aeolicus Nankai-3]ABR57035.1 phosphoribosylformylglycinamidin